MVLFHSSIDYILSNSQDEVIVKNISKEIQKHMINDKIYQFPKKLVQEV